jgi:nitrous oxide reductase
MNDKNVPDTHIPNGRRRFLKTAALAGGAATVAVTAHSVVAESLESEGKLEGEVPAAEGYHVTPHIEAYYRLARD